MHEAQTQGRAPEGQAKRQELETVTIRCAGDSGDGMQLTGSEFSRATAIAGNDLFTFPDYPAEIRAPAGTVAGVSGYQIQFSSQPVYHSGDRPDVLVAMNPAALKANLADVRPNGLIVLNTGAFTAANIEKAGYQKSPLEDGTLEKYQVTLANITEMNEKALAGSGLSAKDVARAKNMFALGMMLWMFDRPMEPTMRYIQSKFGKKPEIAKGNEQALKAGFAYGETAELFGGFRVPKAQIHPGTYRSVSGN